MTDTHSDRLAEIEERLAKATPGPWTAFYAGGRTSIMSPDGTPVAIITWSEDEWPPTRDEAADADLIANAPSDLSYLITEVRKGRAFEAKVTSEAEYERLCGVDNENERLRAKLTALGELVEEWRGEAGFMKKQGKSNERYYVLRITDELHAILHPSPIEEP